MRDTLGAGRARARRQTASTTSAAERAITAALRIDGHPLAPDVLREMSSHFRHDFSQVRVHDDAAADASARSLGARAFTVGSDMYFAAGAYRPWSPASRFWLAHELTHTRQQPSSPAVGVVPDVVEEGESEARAAAVSWARGAASPSVASRADGRPALRCSPLSDQATAIWTTTPRKGRIFDLLRAAPQPDASRDTDLRAFLRSTFAGQPDDLWLAETIRQHGPEPLWPAAALDERARRARVNRWPAEAGDIEASIPVNGGLPVKAYYFRGRTDRRAMVIAGVHGSEVSGVEVVEELVESMRSPGAATPYYTVIVVPRLFPERVAAELRANRRPGTNSNRFRESGVREDGREIPTNRNFPATPTGATPAAARSTAAAATTDAQPTAQTILAQNRILLGFIDRFRPERIASVHANRRASGMRRGGPGSGVFVDPAHPGRRPSTPDPRVEDRHANRDHPLTAEDRLAAQMARRVVARGGRAGGNFIQRPSGRTEGEWRVGQTRYDSAGTLSNRGVSLGGFGPSVGMSVITVEVPWYEGSASYAAGTARDERLRELRAYATSLEEIFLGPGEEAATAP